jgi:hypothetical protein
MFWNFSNIVSNVSNFSKVWNCGTPDRNIQRKTSMAVKPEMARCTLYLSHSRDSSTFTSHAQRDPVLSSINPASISPFFKLLYMIQWQKPALRCVSEAEGLADWSSKRFQVTAEHDSLTESLLHSFISPARVFRPVDAHDEDLPTPELCNLPPGYTLPCRSHLQAMERWHERPYIHTPPGLHASMD